MAKSKKQPEQIVLNAQLRTVMGKKVKQMRKEGIIPGNIYGSGFPSKAISINVRDFVAAYKIAHETGIVYIHIDKDEVPTLVAGIQKHPVDRSILHIDFRKVDLKKKIETTVPILVVGESTAVNHKNGVLLTQNDHLMVEALPQDIPQNIEIDISKLNEIGDEIKVSDLATSSSYIIKEEAEKVIVSVIAHKEESVTPETTAEAPEVITEKAPESGEADSSSEEKKE